MCRLDSNKKAQQLSTKVTNAVNKQSEWRTKYNPLDPNAPKLPSKGEIKAVIPKECFERSALHSFYFVLRDSAMAVALAYVTNQLLDTSLPTNLLDGLKWIIGWNMYAFWMGTIWLGHWVLAHECGHGAFSSSQTLNDIVGFVLHQALLVPYFAWQYTHAKHHRRTNHLTEGETHVPFTGEENGLGPNEERLSFYAAFHEAMGDGAFDVQSLYAAFHEAMGDGAFAVLQIWTHLVLGWNLYLIGFASTGRLAHDGTPLKKGEMIDHFRPNSRMFPEKLRFKILLSTITEIAVLCALMKVTYDYGFLPVFLWYWMPYTWTNAWLVFYTWLQHSDPSVPHYGAEEWTWVKGALSTIDRPYYIFDFFHHKIGSTHVAHHLFHEMPFYKADVATAAIKEFLGPLYNYDPTPFPIAAWRIAKRCHYVEGTSGIQYYKSLEDVPLSHEKNVKKE